MRFLIVGLLLYVLTSCSSTRYPIGYEEPVDDQKPPEWVYHPAKSDTKEAKAFTGTSQHFSTEAEARDDALKNSRKQIIDAMGTYGRHIIKEVISLVGTASTILDPGVVRDDATKLVSESTVKSRAADFFVQQWRRYAEDNRVEYYYKAYVLVKWFNKDTKEAVSESLREQTKMAKTEQDRLNIERALEEMKRLESEDW